MRRTTAKEGLLFLSMGILLFAFPVRGDATLADKVSFRLSNGILMNNGTSGGETLSVAGLDFDYAWFATSQFSLGGGYHLDFDYSQKTLPLSGFEFFARYYVLGLGTRLKDDFHGGTLEQRDSRAIYLGLEFAQQSYYIGGNPLQRGVAILTGSSVGINLSAGIDQRIGDDLDLTLEGNAGVLSFANSDDRFRISGLLIKVGLNYLW